MCIYCISPNKFKIASCMFMGDVKLVLLRKRVVNFNL